MNYGMRVGDYLIGNSDGLVFRISNYQESRLEKNTRLGIIIQKHLSMDEEQQKGNMHNYQRAVHELILANLGLVGKFKKKYKSVRIPESDVEQTIYLAICEAAPDFNPKKGRFSTHVRYAVMNKMRDAFQDNFSGAFSVPYHIIDRKKRIRRAEIELSHRLEREPSCEEVADYANEVFFQDAQYPVQEFNVRGLRQSLQKTKPLKAKNKKGDEEFDFLATETSTPLEQVIQEELILKLGPLAQSLDEREKAIIERKYGLNGYEPTSFADIARDMGITRQGIQQIHNRTIAKLREKLDESREAA